MNMADIGDKETANDKEKLILEETGATRSLFLENLVKEVSQNYQALMKEWTLLQKQLIEEQKEYVMVKQDDLAQLATEITQLKQNLPKVINRNVIEAVGKVYILAEDIESVRKAKDEVEIEAKQWKTRCETLNTESQREKQENVKLRCEVQSLIEQLSQQSDYCSSLGAACCTLLWRVSRCEESIQSILVGTKVDEFLCLVSSTLESYITAYQEEWPQENSDETQFILSLCGIITNIAASAYGRDFLITNQHGRQLLDTYIEVLSEAPNGKSSRLKNLILMSLYNISINQKGIKYISSKKGILGLLSWLLQDEKDVENRVNTLRLIQSVLYDEGNINIAHELQEVLPSAVLHDLAVDKNREIKELALEIISDIQHQLHNEP